MQMMVLEFPNSFGDIDDQRFMDLCRMNPIARLEKTPKGGITIMAPTGGETGRRNSSVITELGIWNKKHSLGYIFDSSTAFKLPNGKDDAFFTRQKTVFFYFTL